jgi:hypothetical protein
MKNLWNLQFQTIDFLAKEINMNRLKRIAQGNSTLENLSS